MNNSYYCVIFSSMKHLLFILIFSLVTRVSASEQDTIILQNNVTQTVSNEKESYFFTEDDLPIQQALTQNFLAKKDINLAYITGWLWVKLVIKNESDSENFILHTSDGHISGLYLYKSSPRGYIMTPAKKHHSEDGREIYNRLPSFFLQLKKGEAQTYYLKINAVNEIVNFSYVIQEQTYFIEFIQTDYLIVGLYFGALLIIILINIFYFYSLKDSIFLAYAIFVLGNFLFTATLDGFTWLLIPDPDIAYHACFFSFRFWADSLLFFIMQLVNLKQHNKLLNTIGYAFIIYHTVIVAIADAFNLFNLRENFMAQLETIHWGICIILVLTIIFKSHKNNRYLFKYYIISFLVLLSVFIFLLIYNTGKAENYLVFEHGMKAGTLIEILTLSFAVSRRFRLTENDLKLKKEDEQRLTEEVKQLEMNVRKAQMNPHFMFNALSSIEYFIFKNEPQQARNYLNKFAQLMRLTLDNSKENYIQLIDDVNALKFYIELEFLRLKTYPHHFEIKLDPAINPDIILVPALLIQPFVENAIWHGLQKKERAGKLSIKLTLQKQELICTIEDDGGGMEKTKPLSNRKSSGIQITKERLNLIHALLRTSSRFTIEDIKDENGTVEGTRVQFNMPYVIGED